MEQKYIDSTRELIEFIKKSPTAFHAAASACELLEKNGFTRLNECDEWNVVPGGKYYVTRNMSSVIAVDIPENCRNSFMIAASHTDSPMWKLKHTSETDAFGKYVKLNVEGYGGGVPSTWLDRPLSIAGRVIVREGDTVTAKLVYADRDLVLIPNTAPHLNRGLSDGYKYNPASDMLPLLSAAANKGCLKKIIAGLAGCAPENIADSDLYIVNRTPGTVWGAEDEFYSTPRIDNIQCMYTSLRAFIAAEAKAINVFAAFDNEETGSSTKQGAASTFLRDVLERISFSLGMDLRRALPSSFMVSADNGHARHPNHPELSDGANAPDMNGGVVIKYAASQKYTSDALSSSIFAGICEKAGVPVQYYANRSDLPGGSTLGSISNTRVALNTVDIGLAQLAMHSSYETGGTADTAHMIDALTAFFSTAIKCSADGVYEVL